MVKVHYHEDIAKSYKDLLLAKLPVEISLTFGEKIPAFPDFEILISGVPTKADIESSVKLHTLIIPWAGLPQRTGKLLKDYPHIKVHNIHHNAETTAEMAITLMLTAAKRIIPIDRDFRKGDWSRRYNPEPVLILKDKTALVLGLGAIGSHIAKLCAGFGMRVLSIRRTNPDEKNKIYTPDRLHELLSEADIVFTALPHTEMTNNFISKKELAMLPDDAIVVNIARGAVIDEEAFYEELSSGRIRAGIDVWYEYPKDKTEFRNCFPSRYPFHTLDNVVLTPHLAGHSDVVERQRMEHLAKLLKAINEGDKPLNPIDLERGY